jgi:serine protease Do
MSPLSGSRRNAIAFALVFCSGAGLLFAQDQSASAISHQVRDIFERAAKAVVKIHGVDEHSEICGTGFFVDPTGTIYTAYTVGGEAGNFTIEFGDKKIPAHQLVADIRSGTAILKVDETTPALPIGKSEELELATPVVSIGYPLDLPKTPNFGMMAGFDRKCLGRYFSTIHLRANVPIQRGEAGAPLLNMKGEVVGIVVSGLENNSACYAVPIEAAEKIRSDFVRFGELRHGWIGVNQFSEAPEPADGSRVQITQVVEHTPAADAGIKPGDILLQLGRKKITSAEDVFDAAFYITAGDVVPVTVMRHNDKLTFHLRADLHPDSHQGLIASPRIIPGVLSMSLDEEVPPSP